MATVISIANQKGGVGKTVTSINLAAQLAAAGRRTLLLDLDPQGHCGVGLGVDVDRLERTVTEALLERDTRISDVAFAPLAEDLEHLRLAPSNLRLATAERELERLYSIPVRVLSAKLRPDLGRYDYVLVDCPPALSRLTLNAFIASDVVMVPVAANYFGLQGVQRMASTLRDLVRELGVSYRVYGLLTRYRKGQKVSREVGEALEALFGAQALEARIRETTMVEKATAAGEPLCLFSPRSGISQDFQQLADELLELERRHEAPQAAVVAARGAGRG